MAPQRFSPMRSPATPGTGTGDPPGLLVMAGKVGFSSLQTHDPTATMGAWHLIPC